MVETKLTHLSVHLIPERQGRHTWVGVFAGKDEDHRSKCGELAFRNEEWDLLAPFILKKMHVPRDVHGRRLDGELDEPPVDLVVGPVKESNDG